MIVPGALREFNPLEVLELPLGPNDSGAETVRGYLLKLLALVWEEEEGFDGKARFGAEGWEWVVFNSLVEAGLVKPGDAATADRVVTAVIPVLGSPKVPSVRTKRVKEEPSLVVVFARAKALESAERVYPGQEAETTLEKARIFEEYILHG